MAQWIDAKCRDCGLQREVVLFTEPTKPKDPLRCPRCASLEVSELHPAAEVHRQLDEEMFGDFGIAYYKLRPVARDDIPVELQKYASPSLWLCMAENGSILLADKRDGISYWWNWETGRWAGCGPSSVIVREGMPPSALQARLERERLSRDRDQREWDTYEKGPK